MAAPTTPPAYRLESPTTPTSVTTSLTSSPIDSSPATLFSTAPSSPLSSSSVPISRIKAWPPSPCRVQPCRLAKTKHRLSSYKNSRLMTLPIEILLLIVDQLRFSSSISVLALRYAHPFFYVFCSPYVSRSPWHQIHRQFRKEEYAVAEKCFAEGFLRVLFVTGKMPCYKCLQFKGKSCFSRDVREGNLAIGVEGFEQRKCQSCGGSEKEMRSNYLKSISTIWGMNLSTHKLPI